MRLWVRGAQWASESVSSWTVRLHPAPPAAGTHLAVGTDEEGLHFDAVVDHGHGGAGGDGGGIARGRGDDGVGHPGAAQGRGDGGGLGEGLGLAAGRWHMADGVVGGGEGWAGVLDADHSALLECRGLLGWPVPARGNGEAVWNQSLWPNLGRRTGVQSEAQAGQEAWQTRSEASMSEA